MLLLSLVLPVSDGGAAHLRGDVYEGQALSLFGDGFALQEQQLKQRRVVMLRRFEGVRQQVVSLADEFQAFGVEPRGLTVGFIIEALLLSLL